ncbi:MAG: hypothetical protein HQM10_07205 [Candidatus Riflebacteria bacterium]|nr:hypothetical protein [Candidatus Riflebacteria bacterium]
MNLTKLRFSYSNSKLLKNFLMINASIILLILSAGCVNKGNLQFVEVPAAEEYLITGSILLSEPVESDLLGSLKLPSADLITNPNFEKFTVFVNNDQKTSSMVQKDGSFTLKKVPFSEKMVLNAVSGKIALKKRLTPDDLRKTDLSKTTINIDSTTKALIWEKAFQSGKNLSMADITAREYQSLLDKLYTAIKLSLQLPLKSVSTYNLDTAMVQNPALEAAQAILSREKTLVEAYSVLQNIVLRKDINLLRHYISYDFGNDWDSNANYSDLLSQFTIYFERNDFTIASYTIHQMEFMPDFKARVRVSFQASGTDRYSALPVSSPLFTCDVLWRLEGTMWKIYRNFPYKLSDPTQLGADSRWGEISSAHAALQHACSREVIASLSEHISENFGNDWDVYSTKNELIETAQDRFNNNDIKIASYTIKSIEFIGSDLAKVRCAGQVRVISHILGIDIDWGKIDAVITWKRESTGWKLFRNLPYKLHHPKAIY